MPRASDLTRLLVIFALASGCTDSAPGGAGAGGMGGSAEGGMAGANAINGGAAGSSAGGQSTADAAGSSTAGGGGGAAGAGGGSGAAGTAGAGSGGSGAGAGGMGGATCKVGPFALTSSAFDEDGPIEEKYRCTGDNVTPPLEWTCGPEGTKSYALTQIHDGSQTLHWVLFNVPSSVSSLPEDIERAAMPAVPAGSSQVKPNVDGSTWYGYSGPCPGGANQSYTYFVYALDVETLPGITSESNVVDAGDAVMEHQLAVATLTGTASKP